MSEEKNEVGGIREVFGQFVKLPAVMDCTLSEVMCLMRSLTSVMTLKGRLVKASRLAT